MQPSLLYARPQPPSDVGSENFQWGEDAASTIAPEDSVSQLDRRFTGKRRVLGPRAMDNSPVILEGDDDDGDQHEVEALRDVYVEPERIPHATSGGGGGSAFRGGERHHNQREGEEDRSTAVPTSSSAAARGSGAFRAVNPSTAGTGGPLSRARGEIAPVPYTPPSMYDDDAENGFANTARAGEDVSHPLVAVSDRSGGGSSGSRIAPYLSRSQQSKGYAVLGGGEGDEGYAGAGSEGQYSAYERSRTGPDAVSLTGPQGGVGAQQGSSGSSSTLVGALSNPLGYFKRSIRRDGGSSHHGRNDSSTFYMPNELALDPPPSHGGDDKYPPSAATPYGYYPSTSLDKMPSIDIVPAQDSRSASGLSDSTRHGRGGPYYDPYKAGARGEMIEPAPVWKRWFWDTTDPERRVWEHKTGRGIQRWPYASWTLAVVMTIVSSSMYGFMLRRETHSATGRMCRS